MLLKFLSEMFHRRPEPAAPRGSSPADGFLDALREAHRHAAAGDSEAARSACGRIFGTPRGNARLIAELHRRGRLPEILAAYRALSDLRLEGPMAQAALNELAFCHSLDGNHAAAVRHFDAAFALHPDARARDPEFDRLYHAGLARTQTWESPRRRSRFRNLLQLLEGCLALDGATAECGCWRGLSSFLMCSRIASRHAGYAGRGHHVFDSFEGLSAPTAEDSGTGTAGQFAADLDDVKRNLSQFPEIEYHPGWIPQSFAGQPERSYRFVHVDVDLYVPTLAAFEYFYPRLAAGGLIVCDDYNWPGGKRAVDEFSRGHGLEPRLTETSQAWLRKPA